MKNHIDKLGIELEGLWYDEPLGFKHDGSVEFDDDDCEGYCRDDCDCYSYCECDECQLCNDCDESVNDCNCDTCLSCIDCNQLVDNCTCIREKQKDCKNQECENDGLCDNCDEIFYDNRNLNYMCHNGSGFYNNCQHECVCECQCECNCQKGGELTSKPIQKNDIADFINNNYPNEVNSSCGMHVHLSFKDDKRDIQVLATNEFNSYFKSRILAWANNRGLNNPSRFYRRLAGQQYCQDKFIANSQLKNDDSDRYTQINFMSYHKFKTIEFRLLPMFDNKQIGIEAIHNLYDIVNDYLNINKPKDFEFNIQINKKTSIHLKLDMVKTGLRVFIKTLGFENSIKSKDYSNYDKFKLYDNYREFYRLNTNLSSLYDDEDNINLTFLRLKGQSHGKSLIIKGIFTHEDIEIYFRGLISAIPSIFKDILGDKI